MSYLQNTTKATLKPPMISIVGMPGSGKSSIAASFPRPIFVQAEDASTIFESWPEENQPALLKQLPEPSGQAKLSPRNVLNEQLSEIYTEEHDFKTLVIDTTSSLQNLYEQETLLEEGGGKSIQDCLGGFQKSYDVIAGYHKDLISKCLKIRAKRGMAIVFLSHVDEYKRKNHPEAADQYTVYGMRMHKKSRDVYVSECDAVIYLKQYEMVVGAESDKKGNQTKQGRVKKSADRLLITSSDGIFGYVDAKSRYRMPTEIDYILTNDEEPWTTINPLLQYIPFFNNEKGTE